MLSSLNGMLIVTIFTSMLQNIYSRHHKLGDLYEIPIFQMAMDFSVLGRFFSLDLRHTFTGLNYEKDNNCLIRNKNYLPHVCTRVHPRLFSLWSLLLVLPFCTGYNNSTSVHSNSVISPELPSVLLCRLFLKF